MTRKQKLILILRRSVKIAWWVVLVLLALLVFRILGAKLKGEVPRVFGYSIMNIVSGSMEDQIPTGTYILVKRVDASEIRRDDIICFISEDKAIRGYPNTHRVVADPIQGEKGLEFVTQGDANPTPDETTAKEAKLIGRYVRNLPGLTKFANMLEGEGMITLMVALMMGTMVLVILPTFLNLGRKAAAGESSKEDEGDDASQ